MPPLAFRNSPWRGARASVNAPLTCPNSSLSRSASGIAAQLIATNGPVELRLRWWTARATSSLPVPLSPVMSSAASASATRSISSLTLLDRRARADHLIEAAGVGHGLAEALDLVAKRAVLDRARQREPQGLDIERLGDEVVRADADGADRRVEAAERGDHHDRHVGAVGRDALAEREPVHPLHVQIGDHDVEVLLVEQLQGIGRRGPPRHDEPAARHRLGQRLRHALVVIDDEDVSGHRRSFTSAWQIVSWGIFAPVRA